jgi:hypothetical protein
LQSLLRVARSLLSGSSWCLASVSSSRHTLHWASVMQ